MRDYAELVKALNEISNKTSCYYCHGESLDCKTAGCYISDAADAIEELLAAVPKWNHASKPPKEKGDYWCNVRSYNFDDTYYQHEVWFDGECFVIDGVCTKRVTHWMPLPEASKEELNKNVE